MKINRKDFRISTIKRAQLNEFLGESMTKNKEKNEIIEANYAWIIHLTICSKMAFLNRDWSKLLP